MFIKFLENLARCKVARIVRYVHRTSKKVLRVIEPGDVTPFITNFGFQFLVTFFRKRNLKPLTTLQGRQA